MRQSRGNFFDGYLLEVILVVIVGIVGRLIPHMPNMTPIIGLSLFAGVNLPRVQAVGILFFTMFISDVCLALIFGYPIAGYFSLFTYTGAAVVVLVSANLRYSKKFLLPYVLGASGWFWVWTNFGVWLTSNLYLKTFDGLLSCYYMALPFLRNGLIGDLVWSSCIFGVFYGLCRNKKTRLGKIGSL